MLYVSKKSCHIRWFGAQLANKKPWFPVIFPNWKVCGSDSHTQIVRFETSAIWTEFLLPGNGRWRKVEMRTDKVAPVSVRVLEVSSPVATLTSSKVLVRRKGNALSFPLEHPYSFLKILLCSICIHNSLTRNAQVVYNSTRNRLRKPLIGCLERHLSGTIWLL